MKVLKPRYVSKKLMLWRALNARMALTDEEQKYYFHLEKGFVGECMFDDIIENLNGDRLIVNDLLLEKNNTTFQIDSICISQNTVFHFEVKNYEGDHYYDSDHFYTSYQKEILNPFEQLNRSAILLRQLLKSIGCNLELQSHVIFIHPEFTLYGATRNLLAIFPTQLNRFFKEFEQKPSKLSSKHTNFANKFIALNQPEDPYHRAPSYQYEQLQKGILCGTCRSFMTAFSDRKLFCEKCDVLESVDTAILRSIKEFNLLFPDRPIMTSGIYDWCGGMKSMRQIRRILMQNFEKTGYGQWTFFK